MGFSSAVCPQRPPYLAHGTLNIRRPQFNTTDMILGLRRTRQSLAAFHCRLAVCQYFSICHQSLYWCTHLMAEVFHMRSSDAMNCHYVHNPTATGRQMVLLVPPQPAHPPLPALRWLTNFHWGKLPWWDMMYWHKIHWLTNLHWDKLPWWDMMYWHEIWSFVHDQQIVTINADRWDFSWLEYRDIRDIVYTDLGS